MKCKFEYKCDFCEKSFFNEEILGLHIKSIHKSIIEGWKKCNYCDKTLSKNSLYLHVKMTHENKVKFLNDKSYHKTDIYFYLQLLIYELFLYVDQEFLH